MMRTLVVFYSHSGHTRRAAERLAREIDADVVRIAPQDEFRWPWGLWQAGRMAYRGETQPLRPVAADPADYDLVVVGTPIWAQHISPPIRSWLEENKERLKDYATLYTYGGVGWPEAGEDMARTVGRSPRAVLDLSHKDEGKPSYEEKIAVFVREIQEAA
ncbi:MAG: flavodoxin family protein [Salinarimonas sp.]